MNERDRRTLLTSTAAAGAVGLLGSSRARAQGAPLKMIITIKRRDGMNHDEFVHYQREVHRPLLESIPETRKYVRRFVVSYPILAPNYSGPSYDSVVEAWFDSMEDMNALYFSENFLTKVAPDHMNFMDLSSYGRIVAEEDVFIE